MTIIGGVYDFGRRLFRELGRILITNINGITDTKGLPESARAIIKRIPNTDESSDGI